MIFHISIFTFAALWYMSTTILLTSANPQAITTASTITIPGPTVTTYIASPTTPPSPQYTDSIVLRTSVLNSTNLYRYQHNATFLSWNDSLASYAQSYSSDCTWAHSHGPQGYGENLAHGYTDIVSSIDAWGNERDLYVFAPPSDITGFSEATGHFTQLVWKNTKTVGCGVTACNGINGVAGYLLVCEYWPPGNVNGVGSGSQKNRYFEDEVQRQVVSGTEGFDTFSATVGATGVGSEPTGRSEGGRFSVQSRVMGGWAFGMVLSILVL